MTKSELNPSGIKVKIKGEESNLLKTILIILGLIIIFIIIEVFIGLIISGFKGVTFV